MILSRSMFLYSVLVNFIISHTFLPETFPLNIVLRKKKTTLSPLYVSSISCNHCHQYYLKKKEWKSCLLAASTASLPSCSCLFSFSFLSSVLYRYPLMLLSLWHLLLLCKLLLRRAKQRYIGFGCNAYQVTALHKCLHLYRVISLR